MPSPEFRESDEILPEQVDVRTAWGNWIEAGRVEPPNEAETGESRSVSDIQDGAPVAGTAATDGVVTDATAPRDHEQTEGVIYTRSDAQIADSAATSVRSQRAWAGEVAIRAARTEDARTAVAEVYLAAQIEIGGQLGDLPVDDSDIADRTTPNRVNLADDVPNVLLKPTFDGYLDVVMHGSPTHTEAHIGGEVSPFTLEETAQLVESTSDWDNRPIRLLSCSTGQAEYAQELADRLGVPVYAPSDLLSVLPDGSSRIEYDGRWQRFEPRSA